jgi:hypothetical protein
LTGLIVLVIIPYQKDSPCGYPSGFFVFWGVRGQTDRQVEWGGGGVLVHGGFFGQSSRLQSIMPWSVMDAVRPFFGLMKALSGQPQGRSSLVA